MLVAPIPSNAERRLLELFLLERVDVARAACGLFAAELLLEFRYQVDGGHIVLFAAWSIHC